MKKTSKKAKAAAAAAAVKIVEAVEATVAYWPREFFREIVTLQDLAEALKDL